MKIEEVVKEIEEDYDVTEIESHGLNVWLDIRNRFFYKLSIGTESNLVINSELYSIILKSMFYGVHNWFRKYDYWFFGTNLNRILVDGKYYDRLYDYPAEKLGKSLLIEFPSKKHVKRNKIASKYIVSRSLLTILEKTRELFLSDKTANKGIVSELTKKYNIEFQPEYSIKKMVAQYKVMKFLLKWKKPKVVFIAPSYTNAGYIKAFKEKKIKVVEIQHGVINKEHFGYNYYADFDRNYFPDVLLTFGEKEKTVFSKGNKGIKGENVIPVGSYYIDHLKTNFVPDKAIVSLKANYRKTCGVALQDCEIGMKLIPFLIEAAKENSKVLFLIKRRRTSEEFYKTNYEFPSNIQFVTNLDVYQTILHADFHITAYSTTALEAPALGVRNLLINFENKAKEYYKNTLTDLKISTFLNSVEELTAVLNTDEGMDEELIQKEFATIIQNNYKLHMDEFLATLK